MGLSDAIKAGVSAAFAAIGDIKQTVSYTHDPVGTYDPSTGQVWRVRPGASSARPSSSVPSTTRSSDQTVSEKVKSPSR